MYYSVTAKFSDEKIRGLYQKLMDGSIIKQKPDGREIYQSMQRAKIVSPGVARWSEMCFCETPLKHEIETVYSYYFDDIETEETDGYKGFTGTPLMQHLKELNF
jgi:nicotinamidase-related amidase